MLKNKKIFMLPVFGFLLTIGLTALLLGLPISMRNPMSYVDTIFEATSAVSATGSTTHDISQDYTLFGQIIILIAMQVGAIGFMMFFSVLYGMTKRKMKLSDAIFLENELSTNNFSSIRKRAKRIVLYTFGVEFFGAWLLAFSFVPMYGFSQGIWYSIFHSVSAFCNVGLDLFGNQSLCMFRDDIYLNVVLIGLMFSGSLGVFVLEDALAYFYTGKKNKIHVESKLILHTSVLLVIIFTILIRIFDPELSILETVFHVVSARNTGLYTVDVTTFSEMGKLLITIVMFIGGSPGSNAGGIRVVVLAVLILTTISNLKGRDDVIVYYRNINDKMIKKAVTVFVVDFSLVFFGMIAFSLSEGKSVVDVLLLLVSSFSNTGLATLDLESLTNVGKWILIFMMYIGRIAPITFVSLFVPTDTMKKGIKYPDMDLVL